MDKSLLTLTFTTDQQVDDPTQIIESISEATREYDLTLVNGGYMPPEGEFQKLDQFAHATSQDDPNRRQ